MQKILNKSDEIIEALEKVIDIRYQYLKELDYENHSYGNKILKEKYIPAVEKLKKALDNLDQV